MATGKLKDQLAASMEREFIRYIETCEFYWAIKLIQAIEGINNDDLNDAANHVIDFTAREVSSASDNGG